ncbi:hypothetical protein B7C42_08258 [Nocardia cerradoensis]|uniref:Uncharacterized protein n=1 Tax=Nocardia cerradoensis TaxID=85688 RepID=A0A231GSZ8_9NOCA|nr:hypothetical protein B7C42_08258 [Nocardia cerradoensis]
MRARDRLDQAFIWTFEGSSSSSSPSAASSAASSCTSRSCRRRARSSARSLRARSGRSSAITPGAITMRGRGPSCPSQWGTDWKRPAAASKSSGVGNRGAHRSPKSGPLPADSLTREVLAHITSPGPPGALPASACGTSGASLLVAILIGSNPSTDGPGQGVVVGFDLEAPPVTAGRGLITFTTGKTSISEPGSLCATRDLGQERAAA